MPGYDEQRNAGQSGLAPIGFHEFIVKVHERCNLACDYCYVYEMADKSWKQRPAKMDIDTFAASVRRIEEHVRVHGQRYVQIVFHGGEPMLAGVDYLLKAASIARRDLSPLTEVSLSIHTNGTLLTAAKLDSLLGAGIAVGVSLDGSKEANDRHRIDRRGAGSFDRVAGALQLLSRPEYAPIYSGILCTVDLENDPVDTYETLKSFSPPGIDLLLPLGNWLEPPPHRLAGSGRTPYADWMIQVFDRWYGDEDDSMDVRFFREIMHLVLGGASESETIGLSAAALVSVETDGTIHQVDTLKSTYEGATETGLDVFRNSFDEALVMPQVLARQSGKASLSSQCLGCDLVDICGGGYYPHRYNDGHFENPSVYCLDLMAIIRHIRARMTNDISELKSRIASHP